MKRSVIIILHCTFWAIIIFLTILPLGLMFQSNSVNESEISYYGGIIFSVVIVPAIFSFYSFYTFLFHRYLDKRKVSTAILYGLGIVITAVVIGCFILLITEDFTYSCHKESDFLAIPVISFIGILFGIIAFVFKGFVTFFKEVKLKEELVEKNYKMEMLLVKSQLDPHFLFNTINNIDVLIVKDPEEASSYLNKLSDIMRFMLYETKTDEIPLKKEIMYIEKYIELQKIRTSNSDYVNYKVIGNSEDKNIAPIIFIPFIENAFKHSDNKKIENAINIEIEITDNTIILKCTNKFSTIRKKRTDSFGLGNELIKRRLNLIYPQKHTLEINQHNNEYSVKLTI